MALSEFELFGFRKRDYFGLRMWHITPEIQPLVKATLAISPTEKWLFTGTLTVDRHEGSPDKRRLLSS